MILKGYIMENKVILMSIDGMRPDGLQKCGNPYVLELEKLCNMRELSYSDHSRLTVVTGRRRIGKTSLIINSMGDEPFVYLFVCLRNLYFLQTHQFLF